MIEISYLNYKIPSIAENLVEIGKKLSLLRSSEDFSYKNKSDGTVVSNADLECDLAISNLLKYFLGKDINIISEERISLIKDEEFLKRIKREGYFLIDPIDGTENFIRSNKDYTINVAYILNDLPLIGLTALPLENKCYYNMQGKVFTLVGGAHHANQNFISSPSSSKAFSYPSSNISTMRFSTGESSYKKSNYEKTEKMLSLLEEEYSVTKIIGNSCMKYCHLLENASDVAFSPNDLHNWDIASVFPLLDILGFLQVNYNGQKLDFSNPGGKQKGLLVTREAKIINIITAAYA